MRGLDRWVRRAALTVMVVLSASACGDDEVSAIGTWALRTVNGGNLPAVLSDDGTTVVTVRQGLLFMNTEECILLSTYITTTSGTTNEEDVPLVCEWEQSGSTVALSWSGGSLTGTVDEQFLRVTGEDGHDYVYERL